MATTPSKSFNVSANGDTALYFDGHPRYDAVRVDFDSGNSSGTDVDVTVKVDSNDEVSDVESNGFGSVDAEVYSDTAIDPSGSDKSTGTTALGRVVAVQIDETSNNGKVEGTVYLHNSDDPAQNADAFANR